MEERQRRPEPILRREPQPAGDVPPLADEARMAVHRPLRLRGRPRGVEHDRRIGGVELTREALELGVVDVGQLGVEAPVVGDGDDPAVRPARIAWRAPLPARRIAAPSSPSGRPGTRARAPSGGNSPAPASRRAASRRAAARGGPRTRASSCPRNRRGRCPRPAGGEPLPTSGPPGPGSRSAHRGRRRHPRRPVRRPPPRVIRERCPGSWP